MELVWEHEEGLTRIYRGKSREDIPGRKESCAHEGLAGWRTTRV